MSLFSNGEKAAGGDTTPQTLYCTRWNILLLLRFPPCGNKQKTRHVSRGRRKEEEEHGKVEEEEYKKEGGSRCQKQLPHMAFGRTRPTQTPNKLPNDEQSFICCCCCFSLFIIIFFAISSVQGVLSTRWMARRCNKFQSSIKQSANTHTQKGLFLSLCVCVQIKQNKNWLRSSACFSFLSSNLEAIGRTVKRQTEEEKKNYVYVVIVTSHKAKEDKAAFLTARRLKVFILFQRSSSSFDSSFITT